MLTSPATFSLLVSLASAAAVANPQQLLVQGASVPALDHINQTSFKKFAIEDMSDAKFRLHHHAVKAMLGDESYLLLRKAELDTRESEVWTYLWEHEMDCGDWMNEDEDDDDDETLYPQKIYLSGRRIFDADPKRVPQDVINALLDIDRREGEIRSQLYRERYCNFNETTGAFDEKPVGVEKAEPKWKIAVPEEYLQYQIPDSILEVERKARDDKWKAKDQEHKQDILAGRVSVRNMKMPDLSKCEKLEVHVWHDDY
ncbi:hypothetical protein KCU98_g571, partial [Aureobasidium melanogenum]